MQAMLVTMMCEAESLPAESRQPIKDSQAVGRRKAQTGEVPVNSACRAGSGKSPKEEASGPDL